MAEPLSPTPPTGSTAASTSGATTGGGPGGSSRRPDIQGLRALAVLLVVAFHAGLPVSGGYLGVDVFFVISGFVITGSILRSTAGSGGEALGLGRRLRRFYARRVRRLLPALAVVVAITSLLGTLLGPASSQIFSARTGPLAIVFNANTYLLREARIGGYFAPSVEANLFLHTWSLSVEEQYYLVFPVLVFGLLALRHGRRATIAVLALLGIASAGAAAVMAASPGTARTAAFYLMPTRFWEFAVGAVLASVLGTEPARASGRWVAPLRAVAVGLILCAACTYDEFTAMPGPAAWLPVAATGVLLALPPRSAGRDPVAAALEHPVAVRLGDWSYSWYLWHWPVVVFATALVPRQPVAVAVAAVASLCPAWWSFRYVEDPIRHGRRFGTWSAPRLAIAGLAIAVLGAGALEGSHRYMRSIGHQLAPPKHADVASGCEGSIHDASANLERCSWPRDGVSTGARTWLIGDSTAGQLLEGLAEAHHVSGGSVTALTAYGCPFADVRVVVRGEEQDKCEEHRLATVEKIVGAQPDLVVVAVATNLYTEREDIHIIDSATGLTATDRASKLAVWPGALERGLSPIVEAGVPILFVLSIPYLPTWDLGVHAAGIALLPTRIQRAMVSVAISRTDAERHRRDAVAAELRAIENLGGNVAVVDIADEICDSISCRSHDERGLVYRDHGHLSIERSRLLGPLFEELLRTG